MAEQVEFAWTEAHLHAIREFPHLLGHILGKEKLTEQHSQWIREAWEAPEHNSTQAHRGAYKTTALTEVGPIWWLLFHPGDRIALVRKPYTEAAKTLATIAQHFANPLLKSLFAFAHGREPGFRVKRENSLHFTFKPSVTKEGNLDAWGIDQQMTGNHYDKVIADDIVVMQDRYSKAEREKTKNAVREIMTNIIDPGKQCIFVGTPWHKDDAWMVCPPPRKYDVHTTGILTAAEIEQKRATTTPSLFAANYELKHASAEDVVFSDPQYGAFVLNPAQKRGGIYAHLDAKYSGTHYAALTIMRQIGAYYFVLGWVFQEHVSDRMDWIHDLMRRFKVETLHLETNADKGLLARDFTLPDSQGRRPGFRVAPYPETMNKTAKIIGFAKAHWDKLRFDPRMDPELNTETDRDGNPSESVQYMMQVLDWREGQEPDDAPDSLASILRQAYLGQNRPTDYSALNAL